MSEAKGIFTPNEKIFKVAVEGIGDFVFKYPTIKDSLDIEARANTILKHNPEPSPVAVTLAMALATVSFLAKETPPSWNLDELYEFEDLMRVYQEYSMKVAEFRRAGGRMPQEESK